MPDNETRPKRSRFDQTTPARPSRFDQRSRSPPLSREKPTRERDSSDRGASSEPAPAKAPVSDPAAAAAAAAARINAQIHSRRSDMTSVASPSATGSASPPPSSTIVKLNGEIYVADGDYKKDIEVNENKNRYMLTKGSTQQMIKDETGADVTTRGSYLPDKSLATPSNPPLYLHITSTSKEGLEKAVVKVDELMKQELPNLVDERRFRRREPVEHVERDEYGRRKWPEERVPINLDPIPGFNLRAQVVGQGGAYVKHIQQETRCRVQIKGQGSGFTDRATGLESDEPMFLHVVGPDANDVQHARELCEDLLANVHEQYERFKRQPPPPPRTFGGGGPHGGGGFNSYGNHRDYSNGGSYGGYGGGTPSAPGGYQQHQHQNQHHYRPPQHSPPSVLQSPSTPTQSFSPVPSQPQSAAVSTPGASADYAAQYAQYYGSGSDPYAAYGGYQNYVAYYQYYQQAMQAQQQQHPSTQPPVSATSTTTPSALPTTGTSASPPPAPPDAGSSYNSPPPPPPPAAPGV